MTVLKEIYRGRIITVQLEEARLPDGRALQLEIVRHPGASAIVALDAAQQVTLLHQFRYAAGGFIWEVPAGIPAAGETPEACARRELREETGLDAEQWTGLGSVLTTPGFCDERIHLFLARGLRQSAQQLDDDEVLSVSQVPLSRALAMIASGEIEDAKSIAALHRAAALLDG